MSGPATARLASTSSTVRAVRYCARGLRAPCLLFLAATAAKSAACAWASYRCWGQGLGADDDADIEFGAEPGDGRVCLYVWFRFYYRLGEHQDDGEERL